ncbi:Putative homogentisate phytyltransferase 1, chloroplastic [Glycine soja]|nr:Putative homogentisate phytyltransferase 1, chloroplastic [Glycine soja]
MEYNLLRFQQSSLNHHYKCIEGGSAYQEWNKKYVVKATSKPSFDSGLPTSNSKNMLDSVKNFLAAFYLFCYPYVMIGRMLSTICASLIAVQKLSDISPLFIIVFKTFQALVPYTFLDVYINGLNQLSDIEIDKVFWICVSLFEMAFGVALLAGATSSCLWIKIVTGLGHAALASVLWYQAKYVDLTNKVSIRSFYMLIWKVILLNTIFHFRS